jgi:hypothetical protein
MEAFCLAPSVADFLKEADLQASLTNQVTASYLSPHNHLITLSLSNSLFGVKDGFND